MFKLLMVLFSVTLLAYMSEGAQRKKAELQLNKAFAGAKKSIDDSRRMDFWCILMTLIMGFFAGLRTDYNDTYLYKILFKGSDTVREYISSDDFSLSGNPLFYIFRSWMRGVTDNYHVYFLVIGLFCYFCYVRFMRRHAENFTLSLYLFVAMGTCVFCMAAMKQAVGMAILTFALDKLIEKKYVGFYFFVLLAAGFHFYSLIFAILPFFMTKPWNIKTFLLLLGVLIVMFSFEGAITAFMEAADDAGKNIAEEEVFDGNGINILRVLFYSVVPIIALVFKNKIFEDTTTEENLFVNMSIICFFIVCMGTVSAANMFARMATYFEFGTILSFPIVINRAWNKKTASLVTWSVVGCYFVYFLYEFTVSKDFSGDYAAISLLDFIKEVTA